MPWHTLPRDYLEEQLDSLGLERDRYETGIKDTEDHTERLRDYPDYHTHAEDDLGPEYETRYKDPRPKKTKVVLPKLIHHARVSITLAPKALPPNACPGSHLPVNGDVRLSQSFAICSTCGQKTYLYSRRCPVGDYKNLHLMPTVSEDTRLSVPSETG